jgi:hypothetical protein
MKLTNYLLFVCTLFVLSNCQTHKTDPSPVSDAVYANDYLSAQKYDKLVIQIQSVAGYELTTQTVDNLVDFLTQRLHKPMGIVVKQSTIASPGKSTYTLDDLINIEKNNRTHYNDGRTLTAYFFIADGNYAEDAGNSKVLGISYSSSAMALFEKTIKNFSGGLGQPSYTSLESTVIQHEFCHILGLVNNGTNMVVNHQDEPHGKHCNNTDCLMYYNAETSDAINNIVGNSIPTLDNNCLLDLKANGGR